jgi:peptidoglycan/xylan/chitin deacetylase (PgdA/CDA1 family)
MAFSCLMYHSLSDGRFPDSEFPKFSTTLARFEDHLSALGDQGFTVQSVADLIAATAPPGASPDLKRCVLTVDDGHRSAMDMADVLERHKANATFFLTTAYCRERDEFLSPEEIRDLSSRGFDFGAHGVTHRALSELPWEEMRKELSDSKSWIEEVLGRAVQSMSLPGGNGNRAVHEAAWALGHQIVGNSVKWRNAARALPLRLNRFVVEAGHRPDLVVRIAAGDLRPNPDDLP